MHTNSQILRALESACGRKGTGRVEVEGEFVLAFVAAFECARACSMCSNQGTNRRCRSTRNRRSSCTRRSTTARCACAAVARGRGLSAGAPARCCVGLFVFGDDTDRLTGLAGLMSAALRRWMRGRRIVQRMPEAMMAAFPNFPPTFPQLSPPFPQLSPPGAMKNTAPQAQRGDSIFFYDVRPPLFSPP
jgi:hypothetical protein